WAGSFTFIGSSDLNLGSGAVTLNANPTLTIADRSLTVAGAISNGTGNTFTKVGAGTLALSGSSSYTGGTTINQGSVEVTADSNLGAGTGSLTFGGGTLRVLSSFSSARPVTLNTTPPGVATIDASGAALTLSGVISGTGNLNTGGDIVLS